MNYGLKDSGKREEFATGSRRDTREGKGRFDLISPYAERRLALVLEKGAVKYGDRNWEKGQPLGRYLDSALRHINRIKLGMHDEDHAAQAMWNLHSFMHTAEMIEQGKLPSSLDDIGYVPVQADYEVNVREEPALPEQSECCQVEDDPAAYGGIDKSLGACSRCGGSGGGGEPHLKCSHCSGSGDEPPAGGGSARTLNAEEEAPEEGAPALWWRIRDYLERNGPQRGDHMWDMVELWGVDDYRTMVEARFRAGVGIRLDYNEPYWCLSGQVVPSERAYVEDNT